MITIEMNGTDVTDQLDFSSLEADMKETDRKINHILINIPNMSARDNLFLQGEGF